MTPSLPRRGGQCSVCSDPRAREIAAALLAGGSVRDVARRYQLDWSTLARHNRNHLRPRLAAAEALRDSNAGGSNTPGSDSESFPAVTRQLQTLQAHEERLDVLRAMYGLYQRALALLDKAEAAKDLPSALRGIREVRESLALIGRLDGSLDGPVAAQGGPVVVQVQYIDRAVITRAAPMLEAGES